MESHGLCASISASAAGPGTPPGHSSFDNRGRKGGFLRQPRGRGTLKSYPRVSSINSGSTLRRCSLMHGGDLRGLWETRAQSPGGWGWKSTSKQRLLILSFPIMGRWDKASFGWGTNLHREGTTPTAVCPEVPALGQGVKRATDKTLKQTDSELTDKKR